MALIELSRATKAYWTDRSKRRARIVLDDVDLAIEEGEFVCLIGPSGCGKTVTLNLIAGFEQPTRGTVRYRGREVAGPGPERGVVFQEYSLLPWLTVLENILFALDSSGAPRATRRDTALSALRAVGMAEFADQRPNLLSGGMKQRVAIARLLAMDSDVFLMDEPFSALDEQTRAVLDASLFQLWRERRKTVVFVTHNISEAVLLASRIVLYSGTPGSIIGQWRVPEDLPRDAGSPEARRLHAEIRDLMPASACSFAEDA